MNVFEDLVSELLDENLLERSVIDLPINENRRDDFYQDPANSDSDEDVTMIDADQVETESFHQESATDEHVSGSGGDFEIETNETLATAEVQDAGPIPRKPRNGREFYTKRAINEISNLQMVEHVLTGVERECMRVAPKVFDDFNAKKTLNAFLQVTGNENSQEHAEAEFAMIQETEAWCSALAARDERVTVSNLRNYCENSKPALSSQALVALGRFYRNLPYSEAVRAKYDFAMTRLFSKEIRPDIRVCLFNDVETLTHINTLYRDWASIPLYGIGDDEASIKMAVNGFLALASEAEETESFDKLLTSDFFGRLRNYKESLNELFYAPEVMVAAISCNVRIGNAYVELTTRERQKLGADQIQDQYADLLGTDVSDAAGRTLNLVDLLKAKGHHFEGAVEVPATEQTEAAPEPKVKVESEQGSMPLAFIRDLFNGSVADMFLSMNRTLLVVSLVLILGSLGIYVWANYFVSSPAPSASAKSIDLDDPILREHINRANIGGGVFFGRLESSWDGLTKDQRKDYLEKVFSVVKTKGQQKVTLIAKDGKVAAYASDARVEVYMP